MAKRTRFYQVRTTQTPILFRAIPWFAPLSEPIVKTPQKLIEADQLAYAAPSVYPAYFHTISWWQLPSEVTSVRARPRLPEPEQQAYANQPTFPYAYTLPFLPQLSEPIIKTPPRLIEAQQLAYVAPTFPYFYPLPFLPQLSEPIVKTPSRLIEARQLAYVAPTFPYFYPLPWFSPLSEPIVKTPRRLLEANQQAYAAPGVFTFSQSLQWYLNLSEPIVKTPRRLQEAQHPGYYATAPPPYFNPISWFAPLSEPVRTPARLSESLQQFFAAPRPTLPAVIPGLPWLPSGNFVRVRSRNPYRGQGEPAPRPSTPVFPFPPWLTNSNVMRVRKARGPATARGEPSPTPPVKAIPWLQPVLPTPPPRRLGGEHSLSIYFPGILAYPISPTWARIQGASGSNTNSSTVSATFAAPVSLGDLVVGMVSWNSAGGTITLQSVTDNKSNSYLIADSVFDTAHGQAAAAFILGNITNGPSTITANFTAVVSSSAMVITEYSGGYASSDPRDGNTGQYQGSPGTAYDAVSSGVITTTQAGDLIWGAYNASGGGTVQPIAGVGFNLREISTPQTLLVTEDKKQAFPGPVAGTFSDTSGNQSAITFVVAIKPFQAPVRVSIIDPVRLPIRHDYYSGFAWNGPPWQQAPTAVPNWFVPLSEPVRTTPRLSEALQQAYASNPAPTFLYPLPFLQPLSEPIVKTPSQLPVALQLNYVSPPQPIQYSIIPWVRVQGTTGSNSNTAALTASFSQSVTAGSVVVGLVSYANLAGSVTLLNVTDDKGNPYIIANNTVDTINSQSTASFILGNIQNAPQIITANFSASVPAVMAVTEYSGGLLVADPRDGNRGLLQVTPGTGLDAISSGSVVTTQVNDLIWGGNDNTTGINLLANPGSLFNRREVVNDANGVIVTEDRLQVFAATVAATFTRSISQATSSFVIAIKPAADFARTIQPLSEPIVKVAPRLLEASQQTFTTVQPTIFFAALPWFAPLSEPVRVPQRLGESAQLVWAAPNWPALPTQLPWFAPLSEPVRQVPRLGSERSPDQAFIAPRVITDDFTCHAVESGDSGDLSVIAFTTPLSAIIGIHETLS